ncbi:MAG: porin, partial [Longimicrobiales bacterium]
MRAVIIAAAVGIAAGAGPIHAQVPSITATLTGRAQFQWNSTSVDADEIDAPLASSTFETRRVRVAASVRVGDWMRGFIEPDFALGRLQLKQVWIALELDSALVVRAGQFKKPFSVINLTSSAVHPMIERG